MQGRWVTIQCKNGNEFDGLLHTCDADGSHFSFVLFGARQRVLPSAPVSKVIKQLTIDAADLVQLIARDFDPFSADTIEAARKNRGTPTTVLLDPLTHAPTHGRAPPPTHLPRPAPYCKPPSLPQKLFAVAGEVVADKDIDVAGGRSQFGEERELQPASAWLGDDSCPEAQGLGSGLGSMRPQQSSSGSWDQFAVNEQMTGHRSNYRDELYTTKLSGKQFTPDELAKAEQLADEIQKKAHR